MKPIDIEVVVKGCEPEFAYEHAAGLDLKAALKTVLGYQMLNPGESMQVSLGVKMRIPEGWVGLLLPRSGLGTKYRVRLDNTIGVIDSDFRNEVMAFITNCGNKEMTVGDMDKIAQLVVVPHWQWAGGINYVKGISEDETDRGGKGFGSSGKQIKEWRPQLGRLFRI